DGEAHYTFLTVARTLGDALLENGITLYAADKIQPPLETVVHGGLRAAIDRSRPVTLLADGEVRQTRTRAETVSQLLAEEGIALGDLDYTRPNAADAIRPDMRVMVVRVREEEIVEEEPIPFEVQWQANAQLEIDHQQVEHWGAPGTLKRSLRVRYENGIEVSRTLAREWVEKPPQNRIISFGTKIVPRQLVTPEGTFTYWRKIRVLATAYTAATCGKSRSDPTYGITRVGWKARKGIVAVDPNVIPLFTEMYAPGYGRGTAADTGGMIKGLHIDLCYDEDNLVHWWKWIDVYLLGSPPPANKIRWILPDYPQER
ncbi:MAG: ubiquitin-like domain-containing protein, partial [Anaerolineae bacterium]|nr:ubiquitin-like domain-containing protein [Anaerolineae bacterium]